MPMLHVTIDDHGAVPVDEVAALAHDMRGPLSTISVEVDILRMTTGDGSTQALDIMQRNVDTLDRLLAELVDLAQLATLAHLAEQAEQEVALDLEVTPLEPIVHAVIDRVPTSERGRFSLLASTPVCARAVPWMIERVLANLVQNALKYGPPAAPILIGIERRRDGRACIYVRDAGVSLTRDAARRLFEKHRRGAGATTKPGSGLGLYICRKIVEQHGGAIGVTLADHATTFFIELDGDGV
jgi:two-component system, OmpR family, sensor histidine kinase KdpD